MNLKEACEKHIGDKDLEAEFEEMMVEGVKTMVLKRSFCNYMVARIAEDMGVSTLKDKLANSIYDYCSTHKDWAEVQPDVAFEGAKQGFLVVAALKGKVHGHTGVVFPGLKVFSGKWNTYVPQIVQASAKYGQPNGIIGVNYAFREMPRFFIYRGAEISPR